MQLRRTNLLHLGALVGVFLLTTSAHATSVSMTWGPGSVSNSGSSPKSATVVWDVVTINSLNYLQVSISTPTVELGGAQIQELGFNGVTDGLSTLTLVDPGPTGSNPADIPEKWSLNGKQEIAVGPGENPMDGFGKYDWSLFFDGEETRLAPGTTTVINLLITSTSSFTAQSLLNNIVSPTGNGAVIHFTPPGDTFYQGNNWSSGGGGGGDLVPEGSSLALLCGGLLPLLGAAKLIRRRKPSA